LNIGIQSSRKILQDVFRNGQAQANARDGWISRKFAGNRISRIQKTRGEAVVAIKLDVVKSSSDAVPPGHGGSLHAAYMSLGNHDHIAQAEGFADQNDFDLNRSACCELLGTEKVNTCGADIPRDESDGMIFRRASGGAEAEREIERRAGILAVLRENADGMGWNASKTAGLRGNEKGLQAESRGTVHLR
jgi:hypothetical protein